jgi:hypothetical protein
MKEYIKLFRPGCFPFNVILKFFCMHQRFINLVFNFVQFFFSFFPLSICWVQYFCPFFFLLFNCWVQFLPFVRSNKLDLQCMDIAQDYIEMLQWMVYLKVFTKWNLKLWSLKNPTPNRSLQFQIITIDVLPLWPSYIRLKFSLWAKFMK